LCKTEKNGNLYKGLLILLEAPIGAFVMRLFLGV